MLVGLYFGVVTMKRFYIPSSVLVSIAVGACGAGPRAEEQVAPAGGPVTPEEDSALPPSEVTQLVLLGTGTPNAEPDRHGSGLAIVVNGAPYLVDAGAGVVRRANEAYQAGLEGLDPANLATVFLTHLHSDHTVGLPDLIFTPWVLGRESPIRIFGPAGTETMAYHIREAYQADIQIRIEGLEPANTTGHQVESKDVEAGVIFRDENVTVTAFPVAHGGWPQAFGYRFDTPDRAIVVSGDTAPTDAIVEYCRGCDILVHEVYSQAGWDRRAPEWQRYHAASHTSAPALAELADRAQPKLLVLTHQLLWGSSPEELLAEVRAGFSGPIAYGRDLDVF